jgi:hypothetical protein
MRILIPPNALSRTLACLPVLSPRLAGMHGGFAIVPCEYSMQPSQLRNVGNIAAKTRKPRGQSLSLPVT